MTKFKSFEEWIWNESRGPVLDAYYDVGQEFQSGTYESQMEELHKVMEVAWKAAKENSDD